MTDNAPILRKAIAGNQSLAYIVSLTETISPLGRKCLLNSPWLIDTAAIEQEYDATGEMAEKLDTFGDEVDKICRQLMCLRDVSSTVTMLASGQSMGDIELYELKALALTITEVRCLSRQTGIKAVVLPDVEKVVELLDPEGTRVAHFYVYDAYSPKLKELRSELKKARQKENADTAPLFAACSDEETRIRRELSERLRPYAELLAAGLSGLGRLDMLIARARLTQKLALTRPHIVETGIRYRNMRNPHVANALESDNRVFQPISIDISEGVTVITGANMAGKSVVLKTVCLCQLMAQYGFYIPAGEAEVTPVEAVLSSIGDAQDELEGLSSYAAEMLCINDIIREKREGKRCLALIDEPARTTNPEEGKALVNAIIELLGGGHTYTLLTTHYSGLSAECRRLRVRGFREEKALGHDITATTINDFIDYSLEANNDSEVPREALRIARLIGVDAIVADTAAQYLDQ